MEKRKFYTLLLLCLMSVNAVWAQYAFTVFDANTGTLTYYYDTYANMQKMGGEEYDSSKDRFKNYAQNVKKAVIDASMKDAPFKNLNKMFFGGPGNELSNMTEITGMENLDTKNVRDMSQMFYGCKSLKSINVSKMNTQYVENMSSMFAQCSSLEVLDLSNFETYEVTDMSSMFDGCKSLKAVRLSSFITQEVLDMSGMFYDCENLTQLYLVNFDVQSVSTVSGMFSGCKKLKTIYCNDDWTKIYKDADDLFEDCVSLVGGNGTTFDPDHTYLDYARPDKSGAPGYFTMRDPSDPVDERLVISECAFEGFDVSSLYAGLEWNYDVMKEIFNKLQKVDANAPYYIKDLDLYKGESGSNTVRFGTILEEGAYYVVIQIRIDGDYGSQYRFPTSKEGKLNVTMNDVVWNVNGKNVGDGYSFASLTSPSFQVGKPAAPTEPEIYAVFDDAAKTMTLYYDKERYDRNGVLEWWNTETDDEEARIAAVQTVIMDESMQNARPTSTSSWFEYFQSLTEIRHLDYLNTEDVEEMYAMFDECESLTNLDVSHFKTDKVKNMGYMFAYVPVKKLDLSNFDTKNVTTMAGMFRACPELTELDLRSFDMSKVGWTSYMFSGCEKLKTIYCKADISELDGNNSHAMFFDCTSLVGGNGTACDGENNVDAAYARPDEEGKPGYFTSSKQGLWNVQGNKVQSTKVLKDGVLLIERNGKLYNAQGVEIQ